jgi:carbonic anhydrase
MARNARMRIRGAMCYCRQCETSHYWPPLLIFNSISIGVFGMNDFAKGGQAMCSNCEGEGVGRRVILKFGAASLAAVGLSGASWSARAAEGAATTLSPDEALAALKSGNERYVGHPELCSIDLAAQRTTVAAHQAPWATVISCADSRVPPELIFGGHGVGELFVARNAGNLVDTATLGTAEYGAAVLGSPLIVVLAHSNCGAVKAACDVVSKNATYPGAIGPMIEPILPAALAVRSEPGDFVNNAAKESARRTAARLTASSTLIAGLASDGKLKIVAAIYDLQTGVVIYLV